MPDAERGVYLWQLRDTILAASVAVVIDTDRPLYRDKDGQWAEEGTR